MTNGKRTTASTAVQYPLPPACAVLNTAAPASNEAAHGQGGLRLSHTRIPGEACIARRYWSADHGQTWTCSGELAIPTGHFEATTLDLLLALEGLPFQPPGTQWRVDACHLPKDAAGADQPPPVSLRSNDLVAQMVAGCACPLCHFTPSLGTQ